MTKRVAVVGMAFRFPGTDTQRYWKDLLQGKDLVSEVDASRWSHDAYLHPDKEHPGTAYTFAAGSIGDVAGFDADFFGISPREAALMDPQQRLLLELCWETIESAGIKPSAMRGSDCGVYVGIASADYSYRMADDLAVVDASMATGNTASIAANRLSYMFDLHGPSMAVDTACSSALVAFHQACRAIVSGEISQAIAGGVSLHLHPYGFITFSKASMLSPNGRCRAFDASGDGYVRSEGGGLFLLKDYDEAVANGDPILAVVAGSAVNTDGRKSGLTVPSADAQAALMRRVYQQAGIEPEGIDYLEAHGTGTPVGDPIETRAIGQALGQLRTAANPLLIGSVKSNLGHLEAASGVAGLVKAIYSLRHRVVPATIGIKEFNPNIRFDDWNIQVVTEARRMRATGTLTIGVNSFGFGGANAHVILQSQIERNDAPHARLGSTAPVPMVVSGRSPDALRAAARDLAAALRNADVFSLYDVAYSAAMHREWHLHRAVVFDSDRERLVQSLARLAEGDAPEHCAYSGAGIPNAQGPVFVYSGNGSQWAGMGRKLMAHPVFARTVEDIDTLFSGLAGWSLAETLANPESAGMYERTEVAQPALFAIQAGMTQMLVQQGVQPAAVVGHSVGEVAAAWACGALALTDAVKVIFHRSQQQGLTKGQGRMAAVGMNGRAAQALLSEMGLQDEVCVAGYNSANGATLAGNLDALKRIGAHCAAQSVFYKLLDLDYAFHSSAMDGIEAPLKMALAGIRPRRADVPFYSTVTGGPLEGGSLNADYWWRNVRAPVRFEQALAGLVADKNNILLEVGPAPVLRSYLNDTLKHAGMAGQVIATGTRNDDQPARIQAAAAQAMIGGAPIDWAQWFPWSGRRVPLPAYPWQRERHWHPVSPEALRQIERRRAHPLLGYRLQQQSQPVWENHLDTRQHAYLADHVVGNANVFPGSGFAEIALAAALQWQGGESCDIENLEILAPLLLANSPSKLTRLSLDESNGQLWLRAKEVGSSEPWMLHASARILSGATGRRVDASAPVLPSRAPDFTRATHLALTQAAELDYGAAFQCVSHGWIEAPGCVVAVLDPTDALAESLPESLLHPALLDCTFQLIIHMLKDDVASSQGVAFVPARIGRLRWIKNRGTPHVVQARLVKRTRHSLTAEFALFDAQGQQIAVVGEARFRSVRLAKAHTDTLAFLDYASIPNPHPAAQSAPNPALLTDALYTRLQTAVQSVHQDGSLAPYAQEIEPLLESLCHSYGAQALHALSNEGRLNRDTLDALRRAAPEAAPLLGWLLSRVAEADADGAQWTVEDPAVEEVTAADIWNSLAREYPGAFAIVHAVGRTGLHLPALLAGEAAPADIRSPNATPASLMRRALGNPANQRIAHALRACLTDALDARAAGQRVRVMEIGADAPLFAPHLCEGLDFHVADFAYASPSQDALEEAEFLLDRFPDLQLQKVGAERVSWAGHADLVVLQCGFENNDALEQSLTHAAASLKPGGTLLLCAMHPAAWLDFVFGTHESWWIDAADGSRVSPQRSVDDWRATLSRHGLHCEQVLELAADAASGPFLLMASSNAATDSIAMPRVEESDGWLILTDPLPAPQAAIAEELARRLSETHRMSVTVEPVVSPGDVHAIIGRVRSELGRITGIVHLAGFTRHDPQRPLADSDPHALLDGQVRRCAITAALAQACERVGMEARLWLLTAGAAPFLPATSEAGNESLNDASLWHYGRTLANEAEGFDVRLVDLPLTGRLPFDALTRELLWPDAEQEVALASESERYVPRMRKNPRPHARPAGTEAQELANGVRLAFEVPGQLRNLRWESFMLAEPGAHEIEVEVKATGLNFRDVMYTLGLLLDEAIENGFAGPTLGLEFAGVVTRVGADVSGYRAGDAVVGFGPASFGNRVITSEGAISPIPRAMSFEAAATIPSTFFTVYYGLEHLAGLERGERVLIHGAAGGVGIAAIQFAQWKGAEIHATAGSGEKRDFLRLMGVEHIYDSRSLDFADEILARTGGEGVDVVLNSLAGEAINRNLSVLKPFGRFLELGKRDFYENTRVGLRPFRNNISYFGIDADQLMSVRPALTRRLFGEVMNLFEQGVLHPLPYEVFDANDVVDAFRHMQQARQIGKIVVAYERGIRAVVPGRTVAAPETVLSLPSQASYLVTGGLSGFGLRTAEWLADKGARHLILISRSGPASDEAREAVTALRERGVTVLAASCDVTRREALADLLALAKERMPSIRGIVHAAMVIDDGLVRNADASRIERVMAPKILGALHLDELTHDLPLDFFVFHSSGTTLFGNPGQSGYVAANGWLEALARKRRSQGRCATSPRWGAIADAGFLARNAKVKDALQSRMGGSALPAGDALRVLEAMLLSGTTDLGVLELDWRSLARFLPSAETPKFAWIARGATFAQQDSEGGEAIEHLLATLDDAELHPVVMGMLKREIGAILRVPDERIDPDRSVYDMGLDSLMGVELVVALENRFGIRLPVMALSETPTISRLAARLIGMLRGDESNQPDEIALQVAQVVAQHADGISSDAIANFAEAVKADEHAPRQRLIQ